jgi:hypothetical protein
VASIRYILGPSIDVAIANAEVHGEGSVSLGKDAPVPGVSREDMEHDPAEDYKMMQEADQFVGSVWLRRAVHAEAFCKGLEAELEKLRAK